MPRYRRYRRRFKKRRYYGRRRGFKRSFSRRKYRLKRITTRRYKRFWPLVMRSKVVASSIGNVQWRDSLNQAYAFSMQNLVDKFGPYDDFYTGDGNTMVAIYHVFFLNPRIMNLVNSGNTHIGEQRSLYHSASAADTQYYSHQFPDVRTLCLRYIGYRVMGVKVTLRFRPGDITSNNSGDAFPYSICAVPFQHDDVQKGTYWNGKSQWTANEKIEDITFQQFKDISPTRFMRRVRGFGAKNGGEVTFSKMLYPWKIYGMTKQQWNNDPKAFMQCDVDYIRSVKYFPMFAVALADYNPSFPRVYSWDYTYSMYIKWEGQKFLIESQK